MVRVLLVFLFLLSPLLSLASASSLYPLPDLQLETAAEKLRTKDYQGAILLAQAGKDDGARDFIMGEASYQLERYGEAIPLLSAASSRLPLLADYALFRQAQALSKTGNHTDALAAAQKLISGYPDSILLRDARFLAAESLFNLGQMQAARDAFRSFIEKYPSGNDSLRATYLAAKSVTGSDDPSRGAAELKNIWLNSPASAVAEEAIGVLKQLPANSWSPFSTDELFRRAQSLYDAKKYSDAITQLEALVSGKTTPELAARIYLKLGQAQFRLRRFTDTEKSFALIDTSVLKQEQVEELAYWRARLQEKVGKDGEAVSGFLRLAAEFPSSPYADNALFEAAENLKSRGKTAEAGQLYTRIVLGYGDSTLFARAAWEAGWERLSSGDPKGAADCFQKLTASSASAEQGLFWLAEALAASGDDKQAEETRSRLMRDYPYGYYALVAKKPSDLQLIPTITPLDLATELPIPQGMERIKAFIAFGLASEARQELSRLKGKTNGNKSRTERAIARLYLELGDYASAMRLFQRSGSKNGADTESSWSISYPVPFRDEVMRHAAQSRLNQELVYAVIQAESSFSPAVASPAGAIGLMQLMPSTAKMMKPESSLQNVTSKLTVPDYNISLGTRHLRDLLDQYNGDEALAVAAYNAGAGNVNRWLKSIDVKNRAAFIEQIPFSETRNYVKKVLTGAAIYRGLYGKSIFSPTPETPAPPTAAIPVAPPGEQSSPSSTLTLEFFSSKQS